jgi:uncharacterized membrane protein YidH (DUF202 family)
MPETQVTEPTPAEKRLDRQLLASMTLSVFAAAFEVIVGFCVAHWVTLTARKTSGYVVCAIGFGLCVTAALLAFDVKKRLGSVDDTETRHGRQLFMANLDLLVAGLVTLLVISGTLVLVTLRPNS